MTVLLAVSRRLPEGAFANDADIRGELATDLVAEAQAKLGGAEARTDSPHLVALAVELGLKQRLQDQPIGKKRLVLDFHPGRSLSRLADVGRRLDFELVGRKPHEANCQGVLRGSQIGRARCTERERPYGEDLGGRCVIKKKHKN